MANFMMVFYFVIAMITAVIVMSFIATVVADVQSDQTANTIEYNVSGYGLTALETMSTKTNLLATVAIAGIIIMTLLTYFAFRRGG